MKEIKVDEPLRVSLKINEPELKEHVQTTLIETKLTITNYIKGLIEKHKNEGPQEPSNENAFLNLVQRFTPALARTFEDWSQKNKTYQPKMISDILTDVCEYIELNPDKTWAEIRSEIFAKRTISREVLSAMKKSMNEARKNK